MQIAYELNIYLDVPHEKNVAFVDEHISYGNHIFYYCLTCSFNITFRFAFVKPNFFSQASGERAEDQYEPRPPVLRGPGP